MSEAPVATKEQIKELLRLADVALSHEEARFWLEAALASARTSNRNAEQRPLPVDHNELLADVAKAAAKLTKQLNRLCSQPHSWNAFWRTVGPGPFADRAVALNEFGKPLPSHRRGTRPEDILAMLHIIERAAQTTKVQRKGRPRARTKQDVVDFAFAFLVRFSPLKPSGTQTGGFAKFAREFYAAAVERHPDDDGGLDRQIREAIKGLGKQQERVRHLSTVKK